MKEFLFLKKLNGAITEKQYEIYQKFKYFCNLENYHYFFIKSDNLIVIPYYYNFNPNTFTWEKVEVLNQDDLKFIFYTISKNNQFFLQNGFCFLVRDRIHPTTYFEWNYDFNDIFYIPELSDELTILRTSTSGNWIKKQAQDYYTQNVLNLGLFNFQPQQQLDPKKDFGNFDNPGYFWLYYDERLPRKYYYRKKYFYLPSDKLILENYNYFDFVGWNIVEEKVVRSELIELAESINRKTVKNHFDIAIKTDFSKIYFWSTNFELNLYQNNPLVFLNSEYLNGSWISVR